MQLLISWGSTRGVSPLRAVVFRRAKNPSNSAFLPGFTPPPRKTLCLMHTRRAGVHPAVQKPGPQNPKTKNLCSFARIYKLNKKKVEVRDLPPKKITCAALGATFYVEIWSAQSNFSRATSAAQVTTGRQGTKFTGTHCISFSLRKNKITPKPHTSCWASRPGGHRPASGRGAAGGVGCGGPVDSAGRTGAFLMALPRGGWVYSQFIRKLGVNSLINLFIFHVWSYIYNKIFVLIFISTHVCIM